jgi:hypothetical protein
MIAGKGLEGEHHVMAANQMVALVVRVEGASVPLNKSSSKRTRGLRAVSNGRDYPMQSLVPVPTGRYRRGSLRARLNKLEIGYGYAQRPRQDCDW